MNQPEEYSLKVQSRRKRWTDKTSMTQQDGRHGLRLDRYVEVLADQRHRRILQYFADQNKATSTTEELARFLVAHELGYHPSTLIEAEYSQRRQELHHNHLPRLDDNGFVEFDPGSGEVRLRHMSWLFRVFLSVGRHTATG